MLCFCLAPASLSAPITCLCSQRRSVEEALWFLQDAGSLPSVWLGHHFACRPPGHLGCLRFCSCTRAAVPALGCGSSVPRVVHPRGPFSGSGAAMGSRRDQTRSLLGDRSACSSQQSRALAPHVGATVPALPLPSPDNHPDRLQDRRSMQSSGGTLAPAGGWCFPGRVSWTFVPAPPAPPPSWAGCGAWPSSPVFSCPLPGSLLLVHSETGASGDFRLWYF